MKYLIFFFIVGTIFARPLLDDPKIVKNYETKYDFLEDYDSLSLNNYLKTVTQVNEEKLNYIEKKSYISSDIASDKYNFDVYIDSYLKTGKRISDDITQDVVYTKKGISLHLDKLLFDRDYFLDSSRDNLEKRLANIDKLDRKNKILVYSILLYSNLYFSGENLKYLKKIFKIQKKIFENIKSKYKNSKKSKLNFLIAKNDLLKIKDSILVEKENYFTLDYSLRHSINSASRKRFMLQPFDISLKINSLPKLQKMIIANSTKIAKGENLLKLKKVFLLSQQKRFIPEIKFISSIGYSDSIEKKFRIGSSIDTTNWEVGLTARIPLYYKNDITLNDKKARYDVMIEKNNFVDMQKTTLIKGTKLFEKIKITRGRLKIATIQLELLKEKLDIYKNKFLVGMISYEEYSKILNEYFLKRKNTQKLKYNNVINIVLLRVLLDNFKGLKN